MRRLRILLVTSFLLDNNVAHVWRYMFVDGGGGVMCKCMSIMRYCAYDINQFAWEVVDHRVLIQDRAAMSIIMSTPRVSVVRGLLPFPVANVVLDGSPRRTAGRGAS